MEMTASTLAMQESNGTEPPSVGPISAYTTPEQLANTIKEFEAMTNEQGPPATTPGPKPGVQASEEKPETEREPPSSTADSNSEESTKGSENTSSSETTRFNSMAKRERSLRQREAALTARLARMKDGEIPQEAKPAPEAKPPAGDMDRLKEMAKENPLELLQEFGLTYTDIANKLIDEPDAAKYSKPREKKKETVPEVEERIRALENRLQEQSRNADQVAYETAMGNLLDEIENFVSNGDGKYALIEAKGDYPMVAEVMQRHYHQNNETLSYEAAAQRVEDYLSDQLKQFVGNKKVAELLNLTAETTPVQQEVAVEATGQKKTLTRDQATSPQKSSAEERPENLSRDASLAWLAKNMDLYA